VQFFRGQPHSQVLWLIISNPSGQRFISQTQEHDSLCRILFSGHVILLESQIHLQSAWSNENEPGKWSQPVGLVSEGPLRQPHSQEEPLRIEWRELSHSFF